MQNRHGLVLGEMATKVTGTAERNATLTLLDRHHTGRRRITLGAEKAYDAAAFISELRQRKLTPHIAVIGSISNLGIARRIVMDGRTLRHPGYAASGRHRKRIEEVSG